ncbi:hypothetical protein HKB23_21795, partial [Vibrio parahaemolyticus]|nr:hypothetical protein [Vibrio parahaemolyticus]
DMNEGTFLAHPDKSLTLKPITSVLKDFSEEAIERAADEGRIEDTVIKGKEKLYCCMCT